MSSLEEELKSSQDCVDQLKETLAQKSEEIAKDQEREKELNNSFEELSEVSTVL